MPIVVKAKKDESTDSVIRKFKKKVLSEDILTEVRKREFHQSPSVIRKERKNEIKRKKYVDRLHRQAANKK
jgi:small subunit ribosomal protein S21